MTVGIADNSTDFSFATEFAQDLTVDVPAPALNETPLQLNIIVQDLPENSVPSVVIEKDSPVAKLFSDEFKRTSPDLPITEVPREELPKVDLGLLNAPQAPIVVLKVPKGNEAENRQLRTAAANALKKLSIVQAPVGAGGIKVFIDPGHGVNGDSGASFNGVSEREIVLKVAKLLDADLKARGFSTMLSNSALRPQERAAEASQFFQSTSKSQTFFLSIHLNSTESGTCPGKSEAWAMYDLQTPGSKAFSENLAKLLQAKGIAASVNPVPETYSNFTNLGVLEAQTDNKALIELEFLCNQENSIKVNSSQWQDSTSKALADAISSLSGSMLADSAGFKTVFATRFDGSSNTAGNCNNSCAALPDNTALGKSITVCNIGKTKCVNTKVGDIGPWCTKDSAYVFGTTKSIGEQFNGKYWRELPESVQTTCGNPIEWPRGNLKSNGAGIDLTQDLLEQLGISGDPLRDQVKWKFA